MLNKEGLVELLTGVVDEVHQFDPDALGIIVFGSFAHDKVTEASDVDCIYVQRGTDFGSFRYLNYKIQEALQPYQIRLDYEDTIVVGDIDGVPSFYENGLLHGPCQFVDANSVFITVDPQLAEVLRTVTKADEKPWSRDK